MTYSINQLVSTGNFDQKKIAKFHARQVKGNILYGATPEKANELADAMVRIYMHTFEIRVSKPFGV